MSNGDINFRQIAFTSEEVFVATLGNGIYRFDHEWNLISTMAAEALSIGQSGKLSPVSYSAVITISEKLLILRYRERKFLHGFDSKRSSTGIFNTDTERLEAILFDDEIKNNILSQWPISISPLLNHTIYVLSLIHI